MALISFPHIFFVSLFTSTQVFHFRFRFRTTMPKRYYCDYCDRSFSDNPVLKKNHFNGTTHQNNRKRHYDSFRDPEIILFEEVSKKPCQFFIKKGQCNFGESCRFSHLTEEEKEKMRKDIEHLKSRKTTKDSENDSFNEEEFKKLVKRLESNIKTETVNEKAKTNSGVVLPEYPTPTLLQSVQNLPPSLLPPPTDSFLDLELAEWG